MQREKLDITIFYLTSIVIVYIYMYLDLLSQLLYLLLHASLQRCERHVKLVRLALSDALLEDLQTSVSRSATPSRDRALSSQVEYRMAANPTRVISEGGR